MQETHVTRKHNSVLRNKKLGNEFISSDVQKKRGVVIYVKNKYNAQQIFKDNEGRRIVIQVQIEGEKIIIVGVYAPNERKD